MKLTLYKLVFYTLLLFSFFAANAQQAATGGTISGKLVDGANGQPLELSTVTLVNKADNKQVQSMQTDLNGGFTLTGVPNGFYLLRASYVGYLTYLKDSIAITPAKRVINLGNIKLRQGKGSLLKEVVVSAQKSQIQLGLDKKSFNVDQSLVSQGGSATDLLTNVPSVQVDVDGNVSLRGSSNVKVLINGKPSALTGGDLADILQSIPASAIETIEVITNPSSKYDSEGDSGIINIVLKKNVQKGFTGSASASAGTQHTYNGTFNIAYQNKNINVYTNYSYRQGDRVGNGSVDKTTFLDNGSIQTQDQTANQSFTFKGQNIRSGIDFNIDPKTTISFTNNINIRNRYRDQYGNTSIVNDSLLQRIDQNNLSNGHGTNLDFTLDFDHKYKKKGEEWTATLGYSSDKNNNFDNLNSDYEYFYPASTFNSVQHNTTDGWQHNYIAQSDFTLPLTNGKLEMGLRSTINNNNTNYISDTLNTVTGNYDYNPFLSNDFLYKENINAVYTNYQHDFGKFSIQGGLRIEDANIRTQLVDSATTNHKQDYFRVYPSLFLTDKLSENQTLQLSYSRRVTRPNSRQLSPFIDESNRLNYQQGNPYLLPEDTHSFELSYINYWKAVTLTSALYYRLTLDNIQQITTPLTPHNLDTTLTQYQNIKSASNAGYELIAKVSPSSLLDLTANLNIYYKYIVGDPTYGIATTSGYSWNGNITANIKPLKKLGIQIRADYQAPQVIPQGTMKAIYGVDGGVRYDLTKKLNLSANVRDIFNTRKYVSDINFSPEINATQVSDRRFNTRTGVVTLAYRFGNNGVPQKRNKNKDKDQPQDQQQDNPDDAGSPGQGGGAPAGGKPAGGKG
ncbi:outer membrane receptor for ferrienterochelin and colicin [Mucilaginibacter frigoritolerans]|uniref:Outer membrane receptor for ferrienterochelin and colicin n=1 Tax=Mucilaginibacter frigoritolerans TaxID=652788 RepID=A0A562UAW5_9SPHI|nr:TonB-dependent receptor [Mucilaginibacter frigoritolerans]TWJ02271.1 outer membrane receptor for ferrienterochelin and colicin [Mucilaginibacter frigoritolerans]